MKDHYQLAAELLQYRDEYEAKQRKKKLYAVRICAAVLCCGAVLAAAGHAVSRDCNRKPKHHQHQPRLRSTRG